MLLHGPQNLISNDVNPLLQKKHPEKTQGACNGRTWFEPTLPVAFSPRALQALSSAEVELASPVQADAPEAPGARPARCG